MLGETNKLDLPKTRPSLVHTEEVKRDGGGARGEDRDRVKKYGDPGFNWRKQVVTRPEEKDAAARWKFAEYLNENPDLPVNNYDPVEEEVRSSQVAARLSNDGVATTENRRRAAMTEAEQREAFARRAAEGEEARGALREYRGEIRKRHWIEENRKVAARAELLDVDFCRWLLKTDERLLRAIQDINEASQDRNKLREKGELNVTRRSNGAVYDDQGRPWRLNTDGTYKERMNESASGAEHDRLGLLILRDSPFRASFQAYLEKRYDIGWDKAVRLGKIALKRESLGQSQDPFAKKQKNSSSEQAVAATGRLKEEAIATFTGAESEDHFGKEACTRERFMWLQNRLLCIFKAMGVLKFTEVRPGCLTAIDHGKDLAFVEKKDSHNSSPSEVAHAFAKLGMYKVSDWADVFKTFVEGRASYVHDLPESIAEMALVSVLMNDVGGDVEMEDGVPAYDIDRGQGSFTYKNTGKVFSVAADWTSGLPEEMKEKMQKIPTYKALIESALAYRSVPFEIACMNKLKLSRDMIEGLGRLASDLDKEGEVSKFIRHAFLIAFDNPLVADKEYDLFKQRVISCATERAFTYDSKGAIGHYGKNLQKTVESGALLQYLEDPAQLLAA